MKASLLFTFLVFLAFQNFTIGQSDRPLLPEKFFRPDSAKVSGYLLQNYAAKATNWDVFIADNTLDYDLDFMSRFEVTGINYENQSLSIREFQGKRTYDDVKMDKVLLWDEGLFDSKTRFRLKLLVITRIQDVNPAEQALGDENSVLLYKGPSMHSGVHQKITAFQQYWFLYKQVGDFYLIGKTSSLSVGDPDPLDFGWIEKDRVELWDKRIVLQPNMERNAVQERITKFESNPKLSISAFLEKEDAIDFSDGKDIDFDSLQVFPSSMRSFLNSENISSRWVRWPILSKVRESESVLKVGVVGRPFSERKFIDSAARYDSEEKLASQLKRQRNIDIVFVIDRTASMGGSIEGVKRAINRVIEKYNPKTTQNNFRFGAVMYTDIRERSKSCPLNSCVFIDTFEPVSGNEFSSWLLDKTIYDSLDTDQPESLFEGLQRGLELFTDPLHTNNLILVGDASGKDQRTHLSEVENLLLANKVSFTAIQAHNLSRYPSYFEYLRQIRDLLLTHGTNGNNFLREGLTQREFSRIDPFENLIEDDFSQSGLDQQRGLVYRLDDINSPFMGFSQVSLPNDSVTSLEMEQFIISKIDEINDYNNRQVSQARAAVNQGIDVLLDNNVNLNKGALYKIYINAGLSPEEIEELLTRKFLSLIEVFVPLSLKLGGFANDLLEYALFLDNEEFIDMRLTLKRMSDFDGTESEARETLLKTWTDIALKHVEPSTPPDQISLEELYQKTFNMPATSDFIKKYTLRDLETLNIDTLKTEVLKMKRKVYRFLFSDRRLIKYQEGNQVYYWIPFRFLP